MKFSAESGVFYQRSTAITERKKSKIVAEVENNDVEVIVVGAGIAGLSVALRLLESGISVHVLEKAEIVGGLGNYAVGIVRAGPTSLQAKAGILDSVEAFHKDLKEACMKSGWTQMQNEPFLMKYAEKSGEAIEWLINIGIRFGGPIPEESDEVPRRHCFLPSFRDSILTLRSKVFELGGKLTYDFRVTSITRAGSGKIDGVMGKNSSGMEQTLKCTKGIILAAGPFSSNLELIKKLIPRSEAVDSLVPGMDGDGVLMAFKEGADSANTNIFPIQLRITGQKKDKGYNYARTKLTPTGSNELDMERDSKFALYTAPSRHLFQLGAILVDSTGSRFVNELSDPYLVSLQANRLPRKETYALFDQRIASNLNKWPNYISTFPAKGYAYLDDYIQFDNEMMYRGDTFKELADKLHLDETLFSRNLEKYNTMARSGNDAQFDRKTIVDLSVPPFYALGPIRPVLTTTIGGTRIDLSCRVLDKNGEIIPRLYAIGDGTAGALQVLPGTHIGWALVSAIIVTESVLKV